MEVEVSLTELAELMGEELQLHASSLKANPPLRMSRINIIVSVRPALKASGTSSVHISMP
jgi:hypothetical protein